MAQRTDLTASTWRASHLADEGGSLHPVDGAAPTLMFGGGRAGGTTGVNRWSGFFTHVASDLCFGQVATTFDSGSDDLMDQEQAFLDILSRVDGYSIAGSLLEVREGDEVLALFESVPLRIEGEWRLAMLDDGRGSLIAPAEGTEITARLEDGAMSGSSGCNRYRATYQCDGESIHISSTMGTRKTCSEPAGVMDQEERFRALLERAERFAVGDGSTLEVFDSDDHVILRFARTER